MALNVTLAHVALTWVVNALSEHATVVPDVHGAVWHEAPPSLAVGKPYAVPNDSPVPVTLLPPLIARLAVLPRVALATGAQGTDPGSRVTRVTG